MADLSFGPNSPEVVSLRRLVPLPQISKPMLQNICVINGLLKSGNKADLHKRIIDLIDKCAREHNYHQFLEVQKSIYDNAPIINHSDRVPPQRTYSPIQTMPASSTGGYMGSMSPSSAFLGGYGAMSSPATARPQAIQQSFQYKYSPFYEMRVRIGEVKTLDVMQSHRNTINMVIKAQEHPILQQCITDPSLRVMVFCAAGNSGAQDICFPYQSELKVNGGEVKANLRGLKNKPGSTKPVDITDLLRLKQVQYPNTVEYTYALTTKKFYLGIYVCKITPLDQLVKQVASGKKIPKASVIQELKDKASDPDIVTTSQNISLKCPLSYMRLKDPARGNMCKHVQCFDITSYLQLQEQGPQWVCPICNNPCTFSQLCIDEYVKDILTNTSPSIEQVTIEPDGSWHVPKPKTEEPKPTPSAARETSYVGDDDLMIAQPNGPSSSRATETPNRFYGASLAGSSIAGSRETSIMPGSATSRSGAGTKRPAPETIDLTLSDDDEPAPPPTKRQNTGNSTLAQPWPAGDYPY